MFLDMLGSHKELWLVIGLAAGLAYHSRVSARNSPVVVTTGAA
jgi:hypothetical protein